MKEMSKVKAYMKKSLGSILLENNTLNSKQTFNIHFFEILNFHKKFKN